MKIEVETLDELRKVLQEMKPGNAGGLLYDSYSTLFPPGEPDASARERAYKLAMETGCEIDNQPDEQTVWFVKHDPADPAKA